MKKLIKKYEERLDIIDSRIKEKVQIIKDTRTDKERELENEMARIENKVLDAKRQLLNQVIMDLEDYI